MSPNLIFVPMFAQVALTAAVWFAMYRTRINHVKSQRIHPQELANTTHAKELLRDVSGRCRSAAIARTIFFAACCR